MFDAFKHILDEIAPPDAPEAPPGAPSLRLAAAVLLTEVMRAHGGIAPQERSTAASALRAEFGLRDDEVTTLLQSAERESMAAYDYFRFTNPLDEQLTPPQKLALVEAMWRVAYADGQRQPEENTVITKVSGLLHVPHGDYIAAKMRAKAGAA